MSDSWRELKKDMDAANDRGGAPSRSGPLQVFKGKRTAIIEGLHAVLDGLSEALWFPATGASEPGRREAEDGVAVMRYHIDAYRKADLKLAEYITDRVAESKKLIVQLLRIMGHFDIDGEHTPPTDDRDWQKHLSEEGRNLMTSYCIELDSTMDAFAAVDRQAERVRRESLDVGFGGGQK